MSEDPELDARLHAMFEQRAQSLDTELSGPALRARAARRPSAARRYGPPVAAAAAITGLAIGLAIAASGGGGGHPTPAGGSAPAVVSSHPSPHRTRAPRSKPPVIAPTTLRIPRLPASSGPVAPSRSGSLVRTAPSAPPAALSSTPRTSPLTRATAAARS